MSQRTFVFFLLIVTVLGALVGCARRDEWKLQTAKGRLAQPGVRQIRDARFRASVLRRDSVLTADEGVRKAIMGRFEFLPTPPRPLCIIPFPTPATAIDPHRSLFVHDRATLDAKDFTLRRTLGLIATQTSILVPGTTKEQIFRQLWDTQSPAPGVVLTGAHCDDNGGTLNGFPNSCRPEGIEAAGTDPEIASRMDEYRPLALVNRLDLAGEGWRNCGEHRIVYGKQGAGKNLIIFEAVLPNPKPGCREGCLPVAQMWASLSSIPNPVDRAAKLETFFYTGLPGFRPVVHVNHYNATGVTGTYGSSGSGQIRTNQFIEGPAGPPWVLKEFKTLIDCGGAPCTFQIVPIMVKVNPFGELWSKDVAADAANPMSGRAADLQSDVVLQGPDLSTSELVKIGYSVDLDNDAAQSFSQSHAGFVDNYRAQMNASANADFKTALDMSSPLTADQVANRALAQSCAGCHMPSTFGLLATNSIGPATLPGGGSTTSWPDALPFVHVDTPTSSLSEYAGSSVFGTGAGQPISPALKDVFLPARKEFLLEQLNAIRCPCRRRFLGLRGEVRVRALAAEAHVDSLMAPRFQMIDAGIKAAGADVAKGSAANAGLDRLLAARESQVEGDVRRVGIAPTEDQRSALRPTPLQLRASTLAQGDARRVRELRTQEVLQLLRQEPPRRTVTGSFRSH